MDEESMMAYACTSPVAETADRCLTPSQLTAYLPNKSPATIKKDLSRRPEQLPPFFRVGRQTLFRESQVLAWLDKKQREFNGKTDDAAASEPAAPRRRGQKRRGA